MLQKKYFKYPTTLCKFWTVCLSRCSWSSSFWFHFFQYVCSSQCRPLFFVVPQSVSILLSLWVRSHERRNELTPVWDFKPAWKQVLFKFHFGSISKRPNILMDMCRHFFSGGVYMIFHHPKWNFILVKMTDMKSIPSLSFNRTCALIATSNESALIHFVSGKLCSHENLMPVWNFISVKMTDMKSIPFWVSFRLNSRGHK